MRGVLAGPSRLWEDLSARLGDAQSAIASGGAWQYARAAVTDWDAKSGASAAARGAAQGARGRLLELDAQLGVSSIVSRHGPPLLRTYQVSWPIRGW